MDTLRQRMHDASTYAGVVEKTKAVTIAAGIIGPLVERIAELKAAETALEMREVEDPGAVREGDTITVSGVVSQVGLGVAYIDAGRIEIPLNAENLRVTRPVTRLPKGMNAVIRCRMVGPRSPDPVVAERLGPNWWARPGNGLHFRDDEITEVIEVLDFGRELTGQVKP